MQVLINNSLDRILPNANASISVCGIKKGQQMEFDQKDDRCNNTYETMQQFYDTTTYWGIRMCC